MGTDGRLMNEVRTSMTNLTDCLLDDFRGKAVIVASRYSTDAIEQIKEEIRPYAVEQEGGSYLVLGFALGKVVDQSVHGFYWVEFEWTKEPVMVHKSIILRFLPDDEPEPEVWDDLPRLM